MGRETSAAEGLHGKDAFSSPVAAADGLEHFLFGTESVALSNSQPRVIDQRKDLSLIHIFKVEVGLARGKKLYDKRQDIAKKDQRREAEKEFKVKNLY